jgi:WD40 repeat protein
MATTFRVFVSSTFADMRHEREALQRDVFPRLHEVCAQRGARLQPVDLQWGVSRAAAEDQQTVSICLQEIDRCKRLTSRPNFITLLGDRYGWCPLPTQIPADEHRLIVARLAGLGRAARSDRALIDHWYRRDDNATPSRYVLRRRPAGHSWARTEAELSKLLRDLTSTFDDAARFKYLASATEREIERGILSVPKVPGHAFCFFRHITNLPLEDRRADEFIDLDDDRRPLKRAKLRLDALKQRLTARMGEAVFRYESRWRTDDIALDHVKQFTEDCYESLASVIEEELSHPPIRQEKEEAHEHQRFGRSRISHPTGGACFIGRARELRAISSHVGRGKPQPLVVHGVSGVGKTALIANAIEQARARNPNAIIVARFIGATPESTNVRGLLASLCAELSHEARAGEQPLRGAYEELVRDFLRHLESVARDRRVLLFLDALDQLSDEDRAAPRLHWIPTQAPKGAEIVLSTLPGPVLEALRARLSATSFLQLGPMQRAEGSKLLDAWLLQAGRTLRPAQRRMVVDRFMQNGLPLFLQLAFEEACRWTSFDRSSLAPDVPRLIAQLLARLARRTNHGPILVERSLGYLIASRQGLADDEMLGLLSDDSKVMRDFRRRSPDSPELSTLPAIVWSRLYFELEPYLANVSEAGLELIEFYHRQFRDVLRKRYRTAALRRSYHSALADYFARQPLFAGEVTQAIPNVRKVKELPYQLAKGGQRARLSDLLAELEFLQAKVRALGPQPLIEDFALLSSRAPRADRKTSAHAILAGALTSAAHVLGLDSAQVPGQILARLPPARSATLRHVTDQAVRWRAFPWLRPLGATLTTAEALIRILKGHRDRVADLALSPSERLLVSSGNDNTARVWDVEAGVEIRTLTGHDSWVKSATFLPDQHRVVTGSFDQTIRVWDLASYREPVVLNARGGRVWSVAALPDGRTIAAGAGSDIELWDIERRRLRKTLRGHGEEVTSLCVSKLGHRIASMSEDSTIRVWDVRSGKTTAVLRGEDVDPDYWVKTTSSGTQTMHPQWTSFALALSPDGSAIVAARRDDTIRVRNIADGTERVKLVGHDNTIAGLAVSSDGRRVWSSSDDHTGRLWRMRDGALLGTFRYSASSHGPVVLSSGAHYAYSGLGDGSICVWNLDAPPPKRMLSSRKYRGDEVVAVAATRNRLLSAIRDGAITIWDRSTGSRLRTLLWKDGSIACMAVTPDARALYVSGIGQYGRTTSRCSLVGRPSFDYVSFVWGGTSTFSDMQITPDGRRLVACAWDGTWVLNLQTSEVERKLDLATLWLALPARGDQVYGTRKEGVCRVPIDGGPWELVVPADDTVWHGLLTPDGTKLICFGQSNIQVWDLSGRAPTVALGIPDIGTVGALTPCGRYLVIGTGDAELICWDLRLGRRLAAFRGVGRITDCAVSRDGSTIIAGEDTGRVHRLRLEGFSAPITDAASAP